MYYPKPRFIKTIFVLCFSFLVGILFAQDLSTIRIKLSEKYPGAVDKVSTGIARSNSGIVQTGINSIDVLAQRYEVRSMQRVFPYAGKFEERHKRHGLHLWYEITMSEQEADKIYTVINEFNAINEIEIAEAQYEKRQIGGSLLNNEPIQYFTPNDALYNQQWHYHNTGQTGGTPGADISLEQAWEIQKGSSDVIVAVTDGGIDWAHTDLDSAMWVNTAEYNGTGGVDDDGNGYIDDIYGYSFGDNSGNVVGDDHGTHVGGTIGALSNNGTLVSGVAGGDGTGNGVRLMSCAAFGAFGTGGFEDTYVYAADMGAVISQNSWGYTSAGYV
jgi:hypothetical protein